MKPDDRWYRFTAHGFDSTGTEIAVQALIVPHADGCTLTIAGLDNHCERITLTAERRRAGLLLEVLDLLPGFAQPRQQAGSDAAN